MSNEIFHSTTYDLICSVIPDEYYKGFNDSMGGTDAEIKYKIMYLQDYLINQQGSAYRAAGKTVTGSQRSTASKDMLYGTQDDPFYRRDMWKLNYERKTIYNKMSNEESSSSVEEDCETYENDVNEFVSRYEQVPNCNGHAWKRRLRTTKRDVNDYVNNSKGQYSPKRKVKSRSSVPSKRRLDVQNLDYSSSDESVAVKSDTNANVDSTRSLDEKKVNKLLKDVPDALKDAIDSKDCPIAADIRERLIVLSDGRHGVNDGMINLDPKCEKIKLPGENSNERSEKIKSSTVNSTQKVCESVPLQVESKEEQERNAMMLNDYYYETRAKNEAERKFLNKKIMNSNRVNAANFVDSSTQTDDDVSNCQVTQIYLRNYQVLVFMKQFSSYSERGLMLLQKM